MIFSFLNVRKKTAASLAGISIAALCLWGLSMWQDISIAELLQTGFAVLAMLLTIMAAALILIATAKLVLWLVTGARKNQPQELAQHDAADLDAEARLGENNRLKSSPGQKQESAQENGKRVERQMR